jgi:hypothetical protein
VAVHDGGRAKIVHFSGSIAVDIDAGRDRRRVVTMIFLAGETVAKDIADFLATLRETKQSQSIGYCSSV